MKHEYKIGCLTWYQEELTLNQDGQILGLFKNIAKTDPDAEFKDLFDIAIKHNLLGVLLAIMLKPKYNIFYITWRLFHPFKRSIPVGKAHNSTIDKIIKDFFLSNKMLIERLKRLNPALDLIIQAAQSIQGPETTTPTKAGKKKQTPA